MRLRNDPSVPSRRFVALPSVRAALLTVVALGNLGCSHRCPPAADYEPGDRFRITVLDGPVEHPECAYVPLSPGTSYEVEASENGTGTDGQCRAAGYVGMNPNGPNELDDLGLKWSGSGGGWDLGACFANGASGESAGMVCLSLICRQQAVSRSAAAGCSLEVQWLESFMGQGCEGSLQYPVRVEYLGHTEPQ